MPTIVFNGKSYSSVDEMPPDVRQAYEQFISAFAGKEQGSILEALQGQEGIGAHSVSVSSRKMQIVVDGKAYSSPEEMPAEVREKYEEAMAQVGQILKDADQNNVPDILEGTSMAQPKPSVSREMGILILIGITIVVLLVVVIGVLVMLLLFR